MKIKLVAIAMLSIVLASCGKSEADIKAEKEALEKRKSDSLAVIKRINDSIKHVADLRFVDSISNEIKKLQ